MEAEAGSGVWGVGEGRRESAKGGLAGCWLVLQWGSFWEAGLTWYGLPVLVLRGRLRGKRAVDDYTVGKLGNAEVT